MESALMRVPPSLSASASASADFPLAVGPAISTAPISAARVMCYRIPNRSSWPGLTRPSTPWLMHKDVDAGATPADGAAEALRELARMKGWGGGTLQIPLRFPVNTIRVAPASMPATLCLQIAESRGRTNTEQHLTGARNDDISPG